MSFGLLNHLSVVQYIVLAAPRDTPPTPTR
jgi:hypothetical protein